MRFNLDYDVWAPGGRLFLLAQQKPVVEQSRNNLGLVVGRGYSARCRQQEIVLAQLDLGVWECIFHQIVYMTGLRRRTKTRNEFAFDSQGLSKQ